MRKDPNPHWIKQHTIATFESIGGYSSEGMIAVVDGKDAGIVSFACDSWFGVEAGVYLTEQPAPEALFDIPEYVNPWDYIEVSDYKNHPAIKGFKQEIAWAWEGTVDELFMAARSDTDLMFPERKLCESDSDYREMSGLYGEIRKYLRKRKK